MTIQSQYPVEVLNNVRSLFSKTRRYTESAFLRKEISERMREKLALVNIEAARVLDLGCGEADELSHLRQRFPQADVYGLDAAEAVLLRAEKGNAAAQNGVQRLLRQIVPTHWQSVRSKTLVCGDFGRLPFASHSVDVIWSNLALHWHPQPDLVLKEWRRTLRVGGLCMFSCFGPDTMRELREAFLMIDQGAHLLDFIDMHDFGDMAVHAGLATPVMDMEKITLRYEKVESLLRDVRALGGNPLPFANHRRLNRAQYHRLIEVLESMREHDGRIPLTVEVVYGHAFKPQASKRENGDAIVQFMPRR